MSYTNRSVRECTAKSIALSTTTTSENTPSKSYPLTNSAKTKNYKNAQSTK